MFDNVDWYEVLGISPESNDDDIRQALGDTGASDQSWRVRGGDFQSFGRISVLMAVTEVEKG